MNTGSNWTWKGAEVLENLAATYEQLYLIPGEEGTRLYPGIVRGGQRAPGKSLAHFHGSKADSSGYVSTPAGEVQVITLHDRRDFKTFLQIMAEGCRRTAIPPTQGAAILDGVINHRKIERHKEQFYRAASEAGEPEPTWLEWDIEKTRFTLDKANYTDALIVLSAGPYSAVSAERAGFAEADWLALSHTIREYHECTHFVCRRFYPDKIDAIWDELVADAVGITSRMDTLLQNGVIGRMLGLPVKFFSDKSAGGLSQSVGALTLLPNILTEVFFGTGIMVAMSLLYIVQVVVMAPALSIPAFLTFVLEIALIAVCMKQKSELIRGQLKADQASQGLVFALFSGIQKIKLSGSENRAFAKWANLYRDKTVASYKWPFPAFMQNELVVGIQMLGLMVAYVSAVGANITVARFAAFSSAFGLVIAALGQLSACTDMVAYLDPVLEMGETILGVLPEVSADKKIVDKLSGAVELSNVSFRYEKDAPNIVDGMSLKIASGEYVAIVGKSGCGKSTLMRLMLGFEDPDEGTIYYGNRDLSTMDLASFRRNVGTVLQSGKLFLGDIFSNITISAPWLNMDDAWEAARLAGMADDIENMPMGMHTIISEGSGGISGGQRQRLMIARAIAPKPSILMFDEATSALDNLTQKIVADSLATLKCTRIVIAHRLSTIKDCDRIIVLDSGKIVEDGTYDELIEKKGFFADLVSRQQVEVA